MSRRLTFRRSEHDERGASLILAIAFVVVIGALAMATLAAVTTGLNDRNKLDSLRNREYAADASVEYAIAAVRATPGQGPGIDSCTSSFSYQIAGKSIRVDCTNVSTLTYTGFAQRNVLFTACDDTGSPCAANSSIIRAQVNYPALGPITAPVVTGAVVQSWSVNG